MGPLKLPAHGLVCLDSSILVYTVERHPDYWPPLRPLWQAARVGTLDVAASELAILETLVIPLRSGDSRMLADYEAALFASNLQLFPINPDILREAARLRAIRPPLRTPDSIHLATASLTGCALFLTNDKGLRGVAGLNVAVLSDHV